MRKKNYPQIIKKAIEISNKGKKLLGNELYFYDNLDWEIVKDRGVWTDVFLRVGKDSVFAFSICSSFAAQGFSAGSVPESFRSLDSGSWNLYVHSKYITHDDVGKACKKWVKIQGELPGVCLGCNIYFNNKRYGFVFKTESYPAEKEECTVSYLEERYRIEAFIGPIRNVKGGVCG